MMHASYPYAEWNVNELLVQATLQSIVTVMAVAISLAFLFKYITEKRTRPVLSLVMFTTTTGISLMFGTIPMFLAVFEPTNQWIYGMPVGFGLQLWWTNLAYSSMTAAAACIVAFHWLVFEKPGRLFIVLYAALLAGFNAWNLYHGIPYGGTNVWEVFHGIPMGLMFFSINLIPWFLLATSSFTLVRKAIQRVDRLRVVPLWLATVFMIASFIMFGLRAVLGSVVNVRPFEAFYWIFFILTAFMLYIGYLSPKWYLRRIGEPHVPLESP